MFLLCAIFAFLFMANIEAISLSKSDSSSEEKKDAPESLKEFVRMVDKHQLNVTIVGSQRKYGSGGWVKEEFAISMHMPNNNVQLTEPTLDNAKMEKYISKISRISKKETVGAQTRTILIINKEDQETDSQTINYQYLIPSLNYKMLTHFQDGKQGFSIPKEGSKEIMYNYIIKDKADPIKNIQVITGNIVIEVVDKSNHFSAEVLKEMERILPKLWMSVDDEVIMARLLVNHLEKKFPFEGNIQAMIGVDNFALSAKKYANLKVAETKVLVFIM